MEEDMKVYGQGLEVAEETVDLDEQIDMLSNDIKKYRNYAIAVWVSCLITFIIKFIVW